MAAKVLVIEDSRVMGEVIVFNLRHHGFQAHLAVNGLQALELLQKHEFQVVLLDYQIPKMNGEEICQAMRQLPGYAHTPVILCSAKGYELDSTRLREELGIVNVLSKPFSPLELMALVNELATSATSA